jgi:hypothetical protein
MLKNTNEIQPSPEKTFEMASIIVVCTITAKLALMCRIKHLPVAIANNLLAVFLLLKPTGRHAPE